MQVDNYIEDLPVKEQPIEETAEAPAENPETEEAQAAGETQTAEEAEAPVAEEQQPSDTGAEVGEWILSEIFPPEDPPAKARKSIRPEIFMGIIALFAAVLMIVMILLCQPYFKEEAAMETEDPEALVERHHMTESVLEEDPEAVILEPTEEETESTEEPTIPPESNPYGRRDFQYQRHNYLYCLRTDSYAGIDVSAFQGDINWKKVKNSGVDFAIIRLGYRGYGKAGRLVEDDYAQKNLFEASKEGLAIGAYFFSQALSIAEVDEEIEFMLDILGDYTLEMPIVLDWEIPTSEARTANMDARTLTDIQLHFCEKMTELGYQPMIYFNWYQSEHLYYLHELEDYPFWLALYQDRMTYPWKIEMWQYTQSGTVPGISTTVDINVYMPD